MTMENMVKRFEAAGFECEKQYLSGDGKYKFKISKDGVSSIGWFKWNPVLNPDQRDKEQSLFISDLLRDFYTTNKKMF